MEIDYRDFEVVLRTYDTPDTCFYLDPPYVPKARRKQRCYHHEMSLDDHKRLLSCIQQVQGMVLLSGYAHPLYQEIVATRECIALNVRCSSAVSALSRKENVTPDDWTRTECIWMNAACVRRQQTVFSDLQDVSYVTDAQLATATTLSAPQNASCLTG